MVLKTFGETIRIANSAKTPDPLLKEHQLEKSKLTWKVWIKT
jgi:hypothetical protein